MTTIHELIEVFERRKGLADKKIEFGYKPEFFKGISQAYKEAIIDLKRMDNTINSFDGTDEGNDRSPFSMRFDP